MLKQVQKKAERVNVRISSLLSLKSIIESGDFDEACKAIDCLLDIDFRKEQNKKITTLMAKRNGLAKKDEAKANEITEEINEALKLIL